MFTFIETALFTWLVADYLSDDEYLELQLALASDPNLGDVIPGSGGVRKLRWAVKGKGKRGGVRVIYFVRNVQGVIWMLTIYSKGMTKNIPAHLLRRIRKEIEHD